MKNFFGKVGQYLLFGLTKFYLQLRQSNSLMFAAAGIPVIVHWSTWMLLFFLLMCSEQAFATYVLVLCSIVPHEFGHAFAARKFGYQTTKIVMLPVGGLAVLKEMSRVPKEEFLISLAGPAVTFGIAAISFLPALLGWRFFSHVCIINVALFVFNMIPAFPMDGGRMLRAVLAKFLPYLRATLYAVRTSQVICAALIILGVLVQNASLILTPFLLSMFASMEYRSTEAQLAKEAEQAAKEIKG